MCDETTAATDDATLAAKGLSRREFAATSAAAALATYASLASAATKTTPLTEAMVDITTPDGKADAFFVHPTKGKHPGVLIWPDAIGLREAKKAMARRLAAQGYAVLVVNPYYRDLHGPLGMDFTAFRTPEGRAKIMPFMAGLTHDKVTRDAKAHIAWLDAQSAVDTKRGIGVQGYCMGGHMTIRSAAAVPDRVKAAATFHGGGLVTDKPDSPHRLLGETKASYLIAVAKDDDAKAPEDKTTFAAAAKEAGRPAEVEVYGGNHGWCVPDAPAYDEAEADRAWGRLLVLYAKL